jgi:hypothetical protein
MESSLMYFPGERLGSGDGERKTLLTRQIAFEPLPASVLFGFGGVGVLLMPVMSVILASMSANQGRCCQ